MINALQNLLFCIPKAAVLHGKSVGFALQKSSFRNVKAQLSLFNRIIFTKHCCFLKKQWKFDVVTYFMDKKENRA
nr:hypothetical protein [Prevotella intermedia]